MKLPEVRIFTEAGPSIGFGHLTRCTALYDAFASAGCDCLLVVNGEAPEHIIGERSVTIVDWIDEATGIGRATENSIVVIDSYIATLTVYAHLTRSAAVGVFIDDTARLPYPAGLVVNGNPAAAKLDWPAEMQATLLAGVSYQLLRPAFTTAHARQIREKVERVLVVSGGTDTARLGPTLGEFAAAAFPDAAIDVVTSPRTAEEMRDSMLAADVALSAAGQTLYELAATGTPAVAVSTADNQISQVKAFESASALLYAGSADGEGWRAHLAMLLANVSSPQTRERLSSSGRMLVDGIGSQRVVRRVLGEVLFQGIDLRPATRDDSDGLLRLANDPAVRSASFSTGTIEPAEHLQWLERRLRDSNTLLLVGAVGGMVGAQVRFDIDSDDSTVSISLDESLRGKGLSLPVLIRGIEKLEKAHPGIRTIHAQVKPGNLASRRLFEDAGFALVQSTDEDERSVTYVLRLNR